MDTILDVLHNHPAFDASTQTDIPSIEEIYEANTITYEEGRLIQARDAESVRARNNETEGERMAREADVLRHRLRVAGVPERYLDAAADMTFDLTGGKGVIVFGSQGTGKTTKAAGILKGWMANNHGAAWFRTGEDILTDIGATYSSYETAQSVIAKYGKCNMLVIDDLGKENPTDQALTKLWQVIDMRYGAMLPTVVTTQYDLSELVREMSRKGGEQTAKAIVSRLYETCRPVSMGTIDHRRKKF